MFFREWRVRREARRKAHEYGEAEWSVGRTANALMLWRASDMKPSEFVRRANTMWEAQTVLRSWLTTCGAVGCDDPHRGKGWEDTKRELAELTGLPDGAVKGARSYPTPEDYQALFRELMILAAGK